MMDLRRDFEALDDQLEKLLRKTTREQRQIFGKMRTTINQEIARSFERYGALTTDTMSVYDRQSRLFTTVRALVNEYGADSRKELYAALRGVYGTGYGETMQIMQTATGRKVRGIAKAEQVTEAIQSTLSGQPLKARIKRASDQLVFNVQEAIGRGIREGQSYSQMARSVTGTILSDGSPVGYSRARMISATESHRIMETAKHDALDHAVKQGIELKKYWVSMRDERVRTTHENMDQIYSPETAIPFEEDFENPETGGKGPNPGALGVPEDDINCRCVAVYVVI